MIICYLFKQKPDRQKALLFLAKELCLKPYTEVDYLDLSLNKEYNDIKLLLEYIHRKNEELEYMIEFSDIAKSVQFSDIDFVKNFSKKLNIEIFFFAPDNSRFNVVQVLPNGDMYFGHEYYNNINSYKQNSYISDFKQMKLKDENELLNDIVYEEQEALSL